MRWSEKQLADHNAKRTTISCSDCGCSVATTSRVQRYCALCSEKRARERARKFLRSDLPPTDERLADRNNVAARTAEVGNIISSLDLTSMVWQRRIGCRWLVNFAVPFSYACSKNAIYRPDPRGHLFLRKEAKTHREMIIVEAKRAMKGVRVYHNKLWIDLLVEKPDHRGDAINVLDSVCDALKVAVAIDDRWFCIKSLDWKIVKGRQADIHIGLSQEEDCDVSACSSCGRLLPFDAFNRQRCTINGVSRNCKECRSMKTAIKFGLTSPVENISTRRRKAREARAAITSIA